MIYICDQVLPVLRWQLYYSIDLRLIAAMHPV